jgi:hypothetical protein
MPIHTKNSLGSVPLEGWCLSTETFWQKLWNVLVNFKEDKYDSCRIVQDSLSMFDLCSSIQVVFLNQLGTV